MPDLDKKADSQEVMAFGIILQKLTTLERAMASIPPLLKKIVDQLEAQAQPGEEVEVASYTDLYPELPHENPTPPDVRPADPLPTQAPRRWWRWFVREGA